jgi:hypothetical protein
LKLELSVGSQCNQRHHDYLWDPWDLCDLAFAALGEEGTDDGGEDSDDELYDGFPLLEVLEHSNFF